MEKKICSKYEYPYPESCVRCVYFMDKNNKISLDFVVSRYPEGVNDYVATKTAFNHYRYLGSINKEMLKTLKSGLFKPNLNGSLSSFMVNPPLAIPLENIESEILFEIAISDIKSIEKDLDAVIQGKPTCKTPVYVYSQEEANEALVD